MAEPALPGNARGGLLARASGYLAHPRWPFAVALLAAVLTLPSVGSGLLFDDYHAKIFFQRPGSPARLMDSPLDLFRFFRGPQQMARVLDMGAPWWTDEGIRAGFWRPLASATHWLDYSLWPDWPSLMHLHSILWYAAAVASVSVFYRRLMGPTMVAGLAALLYAVEDTHGPVVGFLANRSDLPALVFGVFTLLAHDRWRRAGWRAGAFIAPAMLLVSLLFKEAGIATCGYIAAYEFFLRDERWTRRLWALLPYGVVVLAWRMAWSAQGYGLAGVAPYVDPVTEPGRFAVELVRRAPLLLLAQWTGAASELTWVLSRHRPLVLLAIVAVLLLIALLLVPLLRQDRVARFWATGMMLSAIPACAAFPADRMLIWVGIGAFALMARFLTRFAEATGPQEDATRRPLPARALAGFFVVVHLLLAPLAMPIRAAWPMGPPFLLDQLRPSEPMDPSIAGEDLIVVNPPEAFLMLESALMWAADGDPLPRRIRVLMSSRLQPVEVYRPDERTLVLRPEAGFLRGLADRLLRGPDRPLRLGERIELAGMTVEITEMRPDGRPAEAAFRFAVPLEDPSLRWLQWRDGRYVPFVPPPVGDRVKLPGGKLGLHGFQSVKQ